MPVEVLEDGRKRIRAPLTDDDVRALQAGDVALVNGTVYAARDAAHKRMIEMLDRGEELPFDIRGAIVYYVGPTPERPGHVVGSAGPTTASRMDKWTPRLLELGLKGIVGKGGRGPAIREELAKHTAVYMAALGGGGALSALQVKAQSVIAFEDLGTEAIRAMELDDFPVWVVNDCTGRDFYAETIRPWRRNEVLPEDLRIPADWAEGNGGG
ncbi:MAG: fumarate hydratase C-terminal domain-containing protein [Actinobacteria bacterium]|nr:fumarate hydratase C-terminal domain-containing protein [Actinomycetota bacterium]